MKKIVVMILAFSSVCAFAETTKIVERTTTIKEKIVDVSGCERPEVLGLRGSFSVLETRINLIKLVTYQKYLVEQTLNRRGKVLDEKIIKESIVKVEDEEVYKTIKFSEEILGHYLDGFDLYVPRARLLQAFKAEKKTIE